MNAIFNAVSMEEFKRISNVKVAHAAWNILQTVREGTKAVKINKLQQLTSKFESIIMYDDESFNEFYAKLNDIVNSAYNLGDHIFILFIFPLLYLIWLFDCVNLDLINLTK